MAREFRAEKVDKLALERGTQPSRISPNGAARPCSSEELASTRARAPIHVLGKFLYAGSEKFYVRGVTYGTFAPDVNGDEFPRAPVVAQDFREMRGQGFNAVRTYTVPPRWLLDAAHEHSLKVMVGLEAERNVGYLNDGRATPDVCARIRAHVRMCAGHPAVLCYALGNEIPAGVVRWFGRTHVERWLRRLAATVRSEDSAPVTYVNYPSTEYLDLPFLDLVAFNVYLEASDTFEAYLARLQNIAGARPLLVTEVGLDSLRHGEEGQARALTGQLRTSFALGCAGAFVYAWTDEWHRGGLDVDDWAFGLTDRSRKPKPALAAVRTSFAEVPFPADRVWPKVSVIVCCYNGAETLEECLDGLEALAYPNFEVIVVNDGSTDTSGAIARRHPEFRLVEVENGGLSRARNLGLDHATGEIVAYIDCDAWPDRDWLQYLVSTFEATTHACVGGPNLAPRGDPARAECVSQAPGGPNHVLVSDLEAEHVPGCNMAFRASALREIGGFDTRFRVAGDDVDICWRMRDRGWTIGFSPAAVVWHHRRASLRAYWKQQVGYGRAEALLEHKWPEKYNAAGHVSWGGRVYGRVSTRLKKAGRVYHGVWGSAPFQSFEEQPPSLLSSLPVLPEWWIVATALAALSLLGLLWTPLLLSVPLFALAVAPLLIQALVGAKRASFPARRRFDALLLRMLTGWLHVLQPIARLQGRLRVGLTPWRRRKTAPARSPAGWTDAIWSERWHAPHAWVERIEAELLARGSAVARGGAYDAWDLEVRSGGLGAHRLLVAVEEHAAGQQLIRVRSRSRASRSGGALIVALAFLAAWAASARAWAVTGVFGATTLLLVHRMVGDCALASGACWAALRASTTDASEPAT